VRDNADSWRNTSRTFQFGRKYFGENIVRIVKKETAKESVSKDCSRLHD